MQKLSEGRKMWVSVMVIFIIWAVVFIIFEDYDRKNNIPLGEPSDWHLLLFSLLVMAGLGWLLYRYARNMDQRISREQQQRQDQLRRELTQNIGHELKTPVASILGFTDTLLANPDISDAVRRQFIERTNAQARRLTALLQDLSLLNKMDHASELLVRERVDISVMVADITLETSQALTARSMTFRNCLPNDVCIQGNWHTLYSIFRNLTDNAISYAGEATTIELSVRETPTAWHFTFADNGIGVAPEHLPRIFERFYRVDKGRSRQLGGTGLGLSIVKNAVALHGGTIAATANPGGGLRFDFMLCKQAKSQA